MIAHPDTGQVPKKRTPRGWQAHAGRVFLIGLSALYHVARTAQWLAEICLIISGGFIAGLDDYIMSRRMIAFWKERL